MKVKAVLMILLMTALGLICACDGGMSSIDDPTKNTDNTGSQSEPELPDDPTRSVLSSGKSSIRLSVENDKLIVEHLGVDATTNSLADNSVFSLPANIVVDGETEKLNWKYVSKNDNGTVAVYTFEDTENNVALNVKCTASNETEAPFLFETTLINNTESDIRIQPRDFASFTVSLSEETVVWSIKKESYYAEGIVRHDTNTAFEGTGIYKTALKSGVTVQAANTVYQDANSSGYYPALFFDNSGRNGVLVVLEWSAGRVKAKGIDNATADVSISMDYDGVEGMRLVADEVFSTVVPAGDTFVFPAVYVLAYNGDVDNGSNLMKSWFLQNRAPESIASDPNEPLTQMDMQRGLDADLLNVDAIKWDYGWWTNGGFDLSFRPYEGSWVLRNPAYINVLSSYNCTSLAEFGSLAESRGVSWTVYLLLHDTRGEDGRPTSEFGPFNSETNPDWFSQRRVHNSMGSSADLGNEDCVEYLKTALTSFFKDNNISTWRSDFEPICFYSNKANRHDANGSDVMYWCTVGFGEVINHLYENVEGFRFENCSSGGSLKDPYNATLAAVFQTDDSANYLSMRTTFYDSSYIIHPSQLQIAVNCNSFNTDSSQFFPQITAPIADDGYDFHEAMMDIGFRTYMLGVPMFSSWTGEIPEDYVKEYSSLYEEKIRPLVKYGELYHILPRPDGVNWDGIMYADPDAESTAKGVVFLFKPSEQTTDSYRVVLDGLDPEATYHLTFEDGKDQSFTATGETLMTEGFDVTIKYIGSEMIWIEEE